MRLGITREAARLATLLKRANARGVEIVPLPVTSNNPLDFTWPSQISHSEIDWVLFTSANGVQGFFDGLKKLGLKIENGTRYAAIGSKTAEALGKLGLSASFVPSDAYGSILFEEFVDGVAQGKETVVYARGWQVNYDPTELFKSHEIRYVPVVCYETLPQTVEPDIVASFGPDDYILFTAPSAIRSYQRQFGKPVAKPIAIGRSTAAAMNEQGWFGFVTMKEADIDNVLEYVQ